MSRALARLRETTGDPLLVRAGRGLVPTPRALELRDRVGQLVQEAEAMLRPAEQPDLMHVLAHLHAAHQRRLCRKLRRRPDRPRRPNKHRPCGCASCTSPTRTARHCATARSIWKRVWWARPPARSCVRRALFRDRFIGVVRMGHPLSDGEITPARYAARQPHQRVTARPRTRGRSTKPWSCWS